MGVHLADSPGPTIWWTNSLLLKMAIEIVDFPIKNDHFPLQNVSSPGRVSKDHPKFPAYLVSSSSSEVPFIPLALKSVLAEPWNSLILPEIISWDPGPKVPKVVLEHPGTR